MAELRGHIPSGWLFPVVYLAHLIDERYFGIGTADFSTRYLGVHFTNEAWWAVNVSSLLLLTLASLLVACGRWPGWIAMSLAVHLILHGLSRVPASLWTQQIAPGLLTGLLLCTPLGVVTFWRGHDAFSRPQLVRGTLVGVASFQPLWHLALLPLLPGPSTA